MSAPDRAKWTSRKLDYLAAVMADGRLDHSAFKIAFAISTHMNERSHTASVSDAWLSIESGISERHVRQLRLDLRTHGWLTWKRTRTWNKYSFVFENVEHMSAQIRETKNCHKDARKERGEGGQDRRRSAGLGSPQDRKRTAGLIETDLERRGTADLAGQDRLPAAAQYPLSRIFPLKESPSAADRLYKRLGSGNVALGQAFALVLSSAEVDRLTGRVASGEITDEEIGEAIMNANDILGR